MIPRKPEDDHMGLNVFSSEPQMKQWKNYVLQYH